MQFYGNPVQVVDIVEQFGLGLQLKLKPGLARKHSLAENAGDSDPTGRNAIKHNMFLVFEPA